MTAATPAASRVRVDVASQSVTDLEVVVSPSLGYIRFCSAFMAGPDEGFAFTLQAAGAFAYRGGGSRCHPG